VNDSLRAPRKRNAILDLVRFNDTEGGIEFELSPKKMAKMDSMSEDDFDVKSRVSYGRQTPRNVNSRNIR